MSSNSDEDNRILSIEFGGSTIGANIEAAISAGRIVRRPDGKIQLVEGKGPRPDIFIKKPGEFDDAQRMSCKFLNAFMFQTVYGQKAVPFGCRDCYKVKVNSATLRQVMAVKEISETLPATAKSGAEVDVPGTQGLYATYFYVLGLDKARALYKAVRAKIDGSAKLGTSVKMVIKRGCTNYERNCGPSDRYTFDSRLSEIEDYFFKRFFTPPPQSAAEVKLKSAAKLLQMVSTAYRIGDNTYKDFTGGKDLLPPTVTYDPEEPPK